MPALISFFIFLLFSSAQATQPVLEIKVESSNSEMVTKVFQTKTEWFCKTDLVPYHLSKVAPFDVSELTSIQKSAGPVKPLDPSCRKKVFVVNRTGKKVAKFAGCIDQPGFSNFINRLDKSCGR